MSMEPLPRMVLGPVVAEKDGYHCGGKTYLNIEVRIDFGAHTAVVYDNDTADIVSIHDWTGSKSAVIDNR